MYIYIYISFIGVYRNGELLLITGFPIKHGNFQILDILSDQKHQQICIFHLMCKKKCSVIPEPRSSKLP